MSKQNIELFVYVNDVCIPQQQLMDQKILVRADETRLKQILLNLISNAIKYNRFNGSIRISLSLTDCKQLLIEIKDQGKGIDHDKQHLIFQPFNRLGAEQTNIQGSGIGLVITKQLVNQMGGEIGFDSKPGKGSSFWFTIPLNDHEYLLNKDVKNNRLVTKKHSRKTADSVVKLSPEKTSELIHKMNIIGRR